MNILLWRELMAGDPRLVAFSEDDKSGCPWVYGACANGLAAWLLLRQLRRDHYPYVSRRDRWSIWLGPAEWRPAPPGRMVMEGTPRSWWQRLVPHRASFWLHH